MWLASARVLLAWVVFGGLVCSDSYALGQPCSSKDFGVAYNGERIFSVSSENNTCTCSNFASPGQAFFENANVTNLSVGTLMASVGGIRVPAGIAIDFGSGAAGRQTDAGKIGYGAPADASSLNVVGAGVTVGARQVKLMDNAKVGDLISLAGSYRCAGLPGVYYQNLVFQEPYACASVDPMLMFMYAGSGPCGVCGGGLQCTNWSVRWSGYMLAAYTGNITLSVTSDRSFRVWWNNIATPLMDSGAVQNATTFTGSVNVVQGSYYAIRIEYVQSSTSYSFMLQWLWPGQSITTVPQSNLCAASGIHVVAGTSVFDGQTTFNGPVFFSDGVGSPGSTSAINGDLSVSGPARFLSGIGNGASVLSVSSDTAISGTLSASGLASLNGGVSSTTGTFSGLATVGSLVVNGVVSASGITRITSATASSSPSTGALQVTGGLGIGGALNTNGNVSVGGALAVTGPSSFGASGIAASTGSLNIGSSVSLGSNALTVGGVASFTDAARFGSATTTGAGNVGISGTLSVGGQTTFANSLTTPTGSSGTLLVVGNLELTGGLTLGPGQVYRRPCTEGNANYRGTNGHCYMLFNSVRTWASAAEACDAVSARLASLSTIAEATAVCNWYSTTGSSGAWIGYTDSASEGYWQWEDGSSGTTGQDASGTAMSQGVRVQSSFWNTGEPNNSNGEDCAQFAGAGPKWNDAACTAAVPYLCERDF